MTKKQPKFKKQHRGSLQFADIHPNYHLRILNHQLSMAFSNPNERHKYIENLIAGLEK